MLISGFPIIQLKDRENKNYIARINIPDDILDTPQGSMTSYIVKENEKKDSTQSIFKTVLFQKLDYFYNLGETSDMIRIIHYLQRFIERVRSRSIITTIGKSRTDEGDHVIAQMTAKAIRSMIIIQASMTRAEWKAECEGTELGRERFIQCHMIKYTRLTGTSIRH